MWHGTMTSVWTETQESATRHKRMTSAWTETRESAMRHETMTSAWTETQESAMMRRTMISFLLETQECAMQQETMTLFAMQHKRTTPVRTDRAWTGKSSLNRAYPLANRSPTRHPFAWTERAETSISHWDHASAGPQRRHNHLPQPPRCSASQCQTNRSSSLTGRAKGLFLEVKPAQAITSRF